MQDGSGEGHHLKTIIEIIRRTARLGTQPIEAKTSFSSLSLTKPQIGAILLEVERHFNIRLPDHEADQALKGDGTPQWLTEIVQSLNQ